jgi:hypothetical protein
MNAQRVILDDLPAEHALRNRPLRDIHAEHESGKPPSWKPVVNWRIGGATYNQLGEAWRGGRFSVVVTPD